MSKILLEKLSEFLHAAHQKTEIKSVSYPSLLMSERYTKYQYSSAKGCRSQNKKKNEHTHARILTTHTKTKGSRQSTLIKYM